MNKITAAIGSQGSRSQRFAGKSVKLFFIFLLILLLPFSGKAETLGSMSTLEAFSERFQHAFSTKDQTLVHTLFHWQGVNPGDRNKIFSLINRDLRSDLTGIKFLEPDEIQPKSPANLPIVIYLLASFRDQSGIVHYSLHQIGTYRDEYFIALPPSQAGSGSI